MRRKNRSRVAWIPMVALSALALLAAMPEPASAGHEKRDRHRGYSWHAEHDRGHHRDHHGRYDRRYARHVAKHFRQAARREARIHRYTCRPCNHRFGDRGDFHRHLIFKHQISPWRLSFVVTHHSLGWIFYG